MDIATRTQQAIATATKRLEPEAAKRINELNDKFDEMQRNGLVVQDSYGIATNWLAQPAVIQCRKPA